MRAMANENGARLRFRPAGSAARQHGAPEYGPLGTGCPAVEQAVTALYKAQNEESFWTLMNALNYALELDTRVLVPLQARRVWKKAAEAGDVLAMIALGDDCMASGKGPGAALRYYRQARTAARPTPDIAYMPQVRLRMAQYETQYLSRPRALAEMAEAKQGFKIRLGEGDPAAEQWLQETEDAIRGLLGDEKR